MDPFWGLQMTRRDGVTGYPYIHGMYTCVSVSTPQNGAPILGLQSAGLIHHTQIQRRILRFTVLQTYTPDTDTDTHIQIHYSRCRGILAQMFGVYGRVSVGVLQRCAVGSRGIQGVVLSLF